MKMAFFFIVACMCAMSPVQTLSSPNITDLAFKNMDFAMNLYRTISSFHDKNIFLSPLCISLAFATLSMASGGVTREEILRGFNLEQLEQVGDPEFIAKLFQSLLERITREGSLRLDQGTALFVAPEFDIDAAFNDQIKNWFNADIVNVNFTDTKASIDVLNEYVQKKTGNKVTKMITTLDPATQLMLINTIFFQGKLHLFFPTFKKTKTKKTFCI